MPTDQQLAAADLPASALRIALALRHLDRPTVEQVMAATGIGKTQVYEARKILRRHWPDEYPAPPPPGPRPIVTRDSPDTRTPIPDTRTAVLAPISGALATVRSPAKANGTRPAPWRDALAAVVPDTGRSWDAYDLYSAAWDAVLELLPEHTDPAGTALRGNQIALTVDFYRYMTDGGQFPRDLAALLVNQFGKAGLWGLSRALGVTEDPEPRTIYRYARQVAANTVAELREMQP